jgi:hypothetical protein
MRILLDECVPNPLKREFADLDIKTVREMGLIITNNANSFADAIFNNIFLLQCVV